MDCLINEFMMRLQLHKLAYRGEHTTNGEGAAVQHVHWVVDGLDMVYLPLTAPDMLVQELLKFFTAKGAMLFVPTSDIKMIRQEKPGGSSRKLVRECSWHPVRKLVRECSWHPAHRSSELTNLIEDMSEHGEWYSLSIPEYLPVKAYPCTPLNTSIRKRRVGFDIVCTGARNELHVYMKVAPTLMHVLFAHMYLYTLLCMYGGNT